MNTAFKTTARDTWHQRIRASVAAPATPMTPEFHAWVKLQQALCSYPANFHGALSAGYKVGPDELDSVIRALSTGFNLARQQVARKPTFRRGV
jgi:hypothetical protein